MRIVFSDPESTSVLEGCRRHREQFDEFMSFCQDVVRVTDSCDRDVTLEFFKKLADLRHTFPAR